MNSNQRVFSTTPLKKDAGKLEPRSIKQKILRENETSLSCESSSDDGLLMHQEDEDISSEEKYTSQKHILHSTKKPRPSSRRNTETY